MMGYITSLLTQDLYKYSMAQFVYRVCPTCKVKVEFKCRSDEKVGYLKPVVDEQLDTLCELRYTNDEIEYLRSIPWLSEDFVNYLRRFYLFRDQIHTEVDEDGQLKMWAEGPWLDVIWFEVPCLAIVEEAYTERMIMENPVDKDILMQGALDKFRRKVERLDSLYNKYPFSLSEFGLRRRCSGEWEGKVVMTLAGKRWFSGTSNVLFAKKYGVKPSGTMAHEIFMGMQGSKNIHGIGVPLRDVQKETWRLWMEVFRGRNGIMLTDPFGAMACMRDLDWYTANAFSGFRHDSGDPMVWGDKMLARLGELGIDPKTKTFVWSDCLDVDAMEKIAAEFSGKVKIAFGVGTNLVHDIPGIKPLSIVMKMTYANGQPVLKLSDDPGKGMCPDPSLVEYAKKVYDYQPI